MFSLSLISLSYAALAPICTWLSVPEITEISASESSIIVQWSHASNNGFTTAGYDLAYAVPKAVRTT